ncbi:unnamed protein product (mitochondrion) [Plasmodiophora brassicae]|uniref:Uncharacterized protein n=1 Tax=Plasmodiophora brassicae TaxID=37360 RepID=A0A3P3Y1A5_PLABS|nr:unnamed protein product [Plasmodiophora brassicae]
MRRGRVLSNVGMYAGRPRRTLQSVDLGGRPRRPALFGDTDGRMGRRLDALQDAIEQQLDARVPAHLFTSESPPWEQFHACVTAKGPDVDPWSEQWPDDWLAGRGQGPVPAAVNALQSSTRLADRIGEFLDDPTSRAVDDPHQIDVDHDEAESASCSSRTVTTPPQPVPPPPPDAKSKKRVPRSKDHRGLKADLIVDDYVLVDGKHRIRRGRRAASAAQRPKPSILTLIQSTRPRRPSRPSVPAGHPTTLRRSASLAGCQRTMSEGVLPRRLGAKSHARNDDDDDNIDRIVDVSSEGERNHHRKYGRKAEEKAETREAKGTNKTKTRIDEVWRREHAYWQARRKVYVRNCQVLNVATCLVAVRNRLRRFDHEVQTMMDSVRHRVNGVDSVPCKTCFCRWDLGRADRLLNGPTPHTAHHAGRDTSGH